MHRSGFVNIIGQPNVGKSSLANALMNDRLSIITSKPQTTRHRILGIISGDDYQIILSDSPGIIENPSYGLQEHMNKYVFASFDDADILLFVIDLFESYQGDEQILESIRKTKVPKFLVINKTDLDPEGEKIKLLVEKWTQLIPFDDVILTSATQKAGIDTLMEHIQKNLPEGPAYYPKDQFSDKTERFFVSEIIREKILLLYHQEIPYSVEIIVEEFKEGEARSGPILRIRASIYVSRPTQKSIIIGKGGFAIKKLGTEARKDIETFFEKPVFLDLHVTVKDNWRDDERLLKHFGYSE